MTGMLNDFPELRGLTPRELEVFMILFHAKGDYVTRRAIQGELMGAHAGLSFVSNHISKLKRKLRVTQWDVTSRSKQGYRLVQRVNGDL